MIDQFVGIFMMQRDEILQSFAADPPGSYHNLVTRLIEFINPERDYGLPDPERVEEINHGDYQGALVYVIGGVGYQPWNYWVVKVSYGSCSGCDTLQACESAKDYVDLALHVIQNLKEV